MRITQDVREYARTHGLERAEDALEVGLAEKAAEFRAGGEHLYQPA
jgi:phosphomethylpyrimidine synthase